MVFADQRFSRATIYGQMYMMQELGISQVQLATYCWDAARSEGIREKIVRHAAKCRSTATRTNVITRNSSSQRHVRKLPPSVRGLRLRDRLTSPARDARCPHSPSLEPPWPRPPTPSRSARSPYSGPAQSVSSLRPPPSHTTQLTASPRFPRAPYPYACLVRSLPRSLS